MENIQVGLYTQISKSGVKYLYGNYNFLNLFKLHFTIFSNAKYKKEKKNNRIPDMRLLVKIERLGAIQKNQNIFDSMMSEVDSIPVFEEQEEEIPFEYPNDKNTETQAEKV